MQLNLVGDGDDLGVREEDVQRLYGEVADADAPINMSNRFQSLRGHRSELGEASLLDLLELRPVTFPVLHRSRVMDQVEIDLFDIKL